MRGRNKEKAGSEKDGLQSPSIMNTRWPDLQYHHLAGPQSQVYGANQGELGKLAR